MLIKLSHRDVQRCQEFARKQCDTSAACYSVRGQGNTDKVVEQITNGKLAELAAYYALKHQFPSIRPPCFKIFSAGDKSFSPDLICSSRKFHIKTQGVEEEKRYGRSFVFTINDPIIQHALSNEWLVFSTTEHNSVIILGMTQATRVQTLYKEPKLDHLKHSKKVLYWEDIKDVCVAIK